MEVLIEFLRVGAEVLHALGNDTGTVLGSKKTTVLSCRTASTEIHAATKVLPTPGAAKIL